MKMATEGRPGNLLHKTRFTQHICDVACYVLYHCCILACGSAWQQYMYMSICYSWLVIDWSLFSSFSSFPRFQMSLGRMFCTNCNLLYCKDEKLKIKSTDRWNLKPIDYEHRVWQAGQIFDIVSHTVRLGINYKHVPNTNGSLQFSGYWSKSGIRGTFVNKLELKHIVISQFS